MDAMLGRLNDLFLGVEQDCSSSCFFFFFVTKVLGNLEDLFVQNTKFYKIEPHK